MLVGKRCDRGERAIPTAVPVHENDDDSGDFAVGVVGDLGLAGVFVLMLLDGCLVPIPSEATVLFAGFGVSQGRYGLLAAWSPGHSATSSDPSSAAPTAGPMIWQPVSEVSQGPFTCALACLTTMAA